MLRAIVAALLHARIHAAGKLKVLCTRAAVRRDEVHELMELLPLPDAKSLGGEAPARSTTRASSASAAGRSTAPPTCCCRPRWAPRAAARVPAKKSSKQLDWKAAPLVLARGKATSADGVNGWRVIERRTKQLGCR